MHSRVSERTWIWSRIISEWAYSFDLFKKPNWYVRSGYRILKQIMNDGFWKSRISKNKDTQGKSACHPLKKVTVTFKKLARGFFFFFYFCVWGCLHFFHLPRSKQVRQVQQALLWMTMQHRFTVHTVCHWPNRDKEVFREKKKNGSKSKTNIQTSKNGGAGRALLERNTGSWHPRGKRAILMAQRLRCGDGEDLIYKIDVWQILISVLMLRSHFVISNDSVSST